MSASRKLLIIASCLALILLFATLLTLLILHRLGVINAWLFPVKPFSIVLVSISLSCGILAWSSRRATPKRNPSIQGQNSKPARPRWQNRLGAVLVLGVILLNVSTYLLAYQMTHVRVSGEPELGMLKPSNSQTPSDRGLAYTTHRIPISQTAWLEAWLIPPNLPNSKGTVLLFPGNLGTKGSQLLGPAETFSSLGYDSVLIDFQGVGGSSGNTITVGIKEAEDVVTSLEYVQSLNLPSPLILYGISMGTAAILRAISKYDIQPDAIILELPFSHLLNAIKVRFNYHKIPSFLIAELVVFWAGVQQGINGFTHNPIEFAKDVKCPALVIHGEQDKWTTVEEIQDLYENLQGPKQIVISPEAGHNSLIGVNRNLWNSSINQFFDSLDYRPES
ncbi:lysophospholipase [Laspinema sp. A4]|uniref:alpha/beta hydrolase n=1 Tax=Laspinema sp. D2d TaxID=2953686 RepID=UPI0021BB0CCD|nr:lysophospholipase [Laspinema sp. D2d]MCT7985500.1 lysophospholipase [Laspinema sp. D2d]